MPIICAHTRAGCRVARCRGGDLRRSCRPHRRGDGGRGWAGRASILLLGRSLAILSHNFSEASTLHITCKTWNIWIALHAATFGAAPPPPIMLLSCPAIPPGPAAAGLLAAAAGALDGLAPPAPPPMTAPAFGATLLSTVTVFLSFAPPCRRPQRFNSRHNPVHISHSNLYLS